MIFTGEYRFSQSAQRIWEALNDPAVLLRTIPGCESVEQVSETEFAAAVKISIGPMKLRFRGMIRLSDLDPPWRYTIACEGNGGLSGVAKGQAQVTMSPDPGHGTVLRYKAEAALGGMVATLAQKLLTGTASRLADEFFAHFAAQIPEEAYEGPASETSLTARERIQQIEAKALRKPESQERSESPAEPKQTQRAATHQPGLHPVVWSAGLTAITAIVLALFAR